MFGSLIRTMSGPIVTDSLLAFHLSGSLLNVVSILIGHVISGPSSSDRGKLTDAAPRLYGPTDCPSAGISS
ncbi:hypothetical protein HKD28_06855 [Gluconobacter sp. LMG 1744]|uniref:hypothetical protein n=1 Tax=Gluconobacter TaxID=441 RepID=UPI0018851E84|nr:MULTISPECIES: hypothetical protein [Gluconobacter]MBF0891144.1 hypothetical protein [Gluconobacter cadivus]MBS1076090.1 hypothetical protein [Gluconobacter sp. Dm-73]MBS1090050.1 hypothetical protein [Gluconobacter sp. Dm-74]